MSRKPYHNNNILNALNLVDTSHIQAVNKLYNSPTINLMRDLDNMPAVRLGRMLNETRLSSSLIEAVQAFDRYTKSEHWAELSSTLSRAHDIFQEPETISALRQLNQNLKDVAFDANHAIIPAVEQLRSFSALASEAVRPLQDCYTSMDNWQSSLATKMIELKTPWALEEHLGISVVGFARLARLHDISTGILPFSKESNEVFKEELGEPVPYDDKKTQKEREEKIIDSGMNPEIVSFPESSYPSVLFSAGFEFRIQKTSVVRSELGDESGEYNSQYAGLISQLENHLRDLVENELRKIAGEYWYRNRINGNTYNKWRDRKSEDHDRRGDSFALIFYADLMDLCDIICQRNNWNDIFNNIFKSKQDLQISMQRLCPVRNAIAHSRPLLRADQITLFSEASRIFTALGVKLS